MFITLVDYQGVFAAAYHPVATGTADPAAMPLKRHQKLQALQNRQSEPWGWTARGGPRLRLLRWFISSAAEDFNSYKHTLVIDMCIHLCAYMFV